MRKQPSEQKPLPDQGVWKKILRALERHRLLLALSLLLAIAVVALTLYVPVLVGQAIDLIVGKNKVQFSGILPILIKAGIIAAGTAILTWLMNAANNRVTYRVVYDLRTQAFQKIERLPLRYIDAHAYGEVVSRVITDVDQFADGLLLGFSQLFTGVVTILGTLIFMLAI